jgi:DNA-binding response OmpR family regulator
MERKKSILLIEDDLALVEMYKDKLKKEGYRVLTVTDGKLAMQRIRQGADLILLDILMPNLNGFEILKRIKGEEDLKDIPVLVLTNIGSDSIDSDKKLAFSLGAADYMIKSLNTPADVVQKIKSILR